MFKRLDEMLTYHSILVSTGVLDVGYLYFWKTGKKNNPLVVSDEVGYSQEYSHKTLKNMLFLLSVNNIFPAIILSCMFLSLIGTNPATIFKIQNDTVLLLNQPSLSFLSVFLLFVPFFFKHPTVMWQFDRKCFFLSELLVLAESPNWGRKHSGL